MIRAVESTAPDSPAARAKGTVKPSDMPMTMSRTVSEAVKCFSMCGVCGIRDHLCEGSFLRAKATFSHGHRPLIWWSPAFPYGLVLFSCLYNDRWDRRHRF